MNYKTQREINEPGLCGYRGKSAHLSSGCCHPSVLERDADAHMAPGGQARAVHGNSAVNSVQITQ